MAPKVKFTRGELTAAALKVVRERGTGALTAKAVADELLISTRPIFTCFSTMDELRRDVRAAAERTFDAYIAEGLRNPVPFYGVGMQYIRFAREEPELYRLLFLEPSEGGSGAYETMLHLMEKVRPSLERIYRMNTAEAGRYFRDLWLVVHGFAALIVSGVCPYTDREIGQTLTGFSVSVCKAIKEIPGFTDGTFDRDAVFRRLIREPSPQSEAADSAPQDFPAKK